MTPLLFRLSFAALALLFFPFAIQDAPGQEVDRPTFRGALPEEQQELIRLLAENHTQIDREIVWTDTGYRASTTSSGPALVSALHRHFAYMRERLHAGGRVRQWDPAFAEITAHYKNLRTEWKELQNGLEVEVIGLTHEGIQAGKNHGRVVSGFVQEGPKAVARKHAAVLQEGTEP